MIDSNIKNNRKMLDPLLSVSSNFLREYAHTNGYAIYDFMNKYEVGHSAYGSLMDAAAKGKGVIAHRLYGHHLVYDMPLDDFDATKQFLDHELSDLFTKQGLPIIPGEVLDDAGILKYCDSIKRSWNFVNGFDILSGTVSIYTGACDFKKYIFDGCSIESVNEMATKLGIGALEMAIAISSANPFLLIGSVLRLTSTIVGIFNPTARIYISYLAKENHQFSIQFENDSFDIQKLNYLCSIDYENYRNSIEFENSKYDIKMIK